MTIAEFAKARNISYESARKRVARYKDQLPEHIQKTKRGFELDDYAVQYLDKQRERVLASLQIQVVSADELEKLKRELAELQQENKALKEKLEAAGIEIPKKPKRKWYEVLFGTNES